MNLKLMLWLGSVLAVFAILFGSYRYGRHVERIMQESARMAVIIEQQNQNDELKTRLEVQHANDQKQIDALAADLRHVRVRLPTGCNSPNPASGSANTIAASQPLPVDTQAAFDAFAAGLGELTKEADELLATCRVVVEWAKAQGLSNSVK